MAGDVRITITGEDQTKAAFASVEAAAKKVERTLSGLSKFSLGSAGIGIGFAALAIHLEHVAEKFKDIDPNAKAFTDSMEKLKGIVDQGLIAAFTLLNPPLELLGTVLQRDADFLSEFIAQWKLYKAEHVHEEILRLQAIKEGHNPQSGLQALGSVAQLKAQVAAENNQINPLHDRDLSGALDETGTANMVGGILKGLAAAKEAATKLADIRFKAAAHGYDMEAQYAEHMEAERVKAAEEANKKLEDDERGLMDYFDKIDLDHLKKQNEDQKKLDEERQKAAQTFGDLFANVLVQSNKDGLKQVLEDFVKTLAIMAARAQAMKLFSAAESSGGWFGTALTSIFGARASGGPVGAGQSYLVGENGPEMFTPMSAGNITPNDKLGNVVNIHQNVSVGAGASRAEVAAAMNVAKNSAIAAIQNSMKRSRTP
jgi:hypothetical protein